MDYRTFGLLACPAGPAGNVPIVPGENSLHLRIRPVAPTGVDDDGSNGEVDTLSQGVCCNDYLVPALTEICFNCLANGVWQITMMKSYSVFKQACDEVFCAQPFPCGDGGSR